MTRKCVDVQVETLVRACNPVEGGRVIWRHAVRAMSQGGDARPEAVLYDGTYLVGRDGRERSHC